MDNKPLVSIIIPTYGIPVFLEQSIQSIQNQTYSNWELIVVDDNNPDTQARKETEACIRRFCADPRIRYLQHEKNKNGAAARNTGIAVATGKYIAFLDSDDLYLPTRLESCLAFMESNSDPRIGGVYTGCEFRRGGKKYHVETNVKSGNFILETLACTFVFCTGSNIFMRGDIVRALLFDERFLRHQDYEFLVRFFEKYDLHAIPEVLVIKNNENLNVPNYAKNVQIKRLYLEKYQYLTDQLSADDRSYVFASHCIALANIAASSGLRSHAAACLRACSQYQKPSVRARIKVLLLYARQMLH